MVLPAMQGEYRVLPPGRHSATLSEIYERFVVQAPHRERRELIYRALTLHLELTRAIAPDAAYWLDGGFVTHKEWRQPVDADLVVVAAEEQFMALHVEEALPLHTFLELTAEQPMVRTSKLHPMGGLLDVFVIPDLPEHVAVWDHRWQLVNGPDGELMSGAVKGYVEVLFDE